MEEDYKKLLGQDLSKLREVTQTPLQALSFLSGLDEEEILKMEQNAADSSVDDWNSVLSAMGCRLGIVNITDNKVPDCLQQDVKRKRVVMIIGNGFDLDLGLKTGYGDFARSDFWPFHDAYLTKPDYVEPVYSPLVEELNKAKINKWFDFEEVLRQFGMKAYKDYGNDYPHAEVDKLALNLFCLALKKYLSHEMDSYFADPTRIEESKKTYAKKVLSEMMDSKAIIYSFNYTDLDKLAYYVVEENPTKEGFIKWSRVNRNFHQVHGTVYSSNIVLGVEENCVIPNNLFFLKKVAQLNFRETSILSHLKEADKIVFFGHSLGNIDACYFQQFFTMLSEPDINNGKEVEIYTYNEDSIQQIKDNIRKMNGERYLQFANNNYVEFFMTKR